MRSSATFMPMAVLLCAACPRHDDQPDLERIYGQAARSQDDLRNPVVVIPGILGSKLVRSSDGRTVWGAFGGDSIDPTTAEGAKLFSLPMKEGVPLSELKDDVAPAGALDRLNVDVLGLRFDLNAYVYILKSLGVGGFRDETLGEAGAVDYGPLHYTCFQFAYDWRRDNVENARRLHDFLVHKRRYVQAIIKQHTGVADAPVKFDLVAHSMGGLIARYFLMYGDADLPSDGAPPKVTWAGAELVDRAILVATPSGGANESLVELVAGAHFAPLLPAYRPALLGTMPSIYELLPRGRHGALVRAGPPSERVSDLLDLQLWDKLQWGLLDPKEDDVLSQLLPDAKSRAERLRIARDHLEKTLDRARKFQAAMDVPAPLPSGLRLYLIAGDAIPTSETLEIGTTGGLSVVRQAPGDGTVLRSSALLDEREGGDWRVGLDSPIDWTSVLFFDRDHLGLTQSVEFTDNVLFLLLEGTRGRVGNPAPPTPAALDAGPGGTAAATPSRG